MKILGLTGSIGMGKSTLARMAGRMRIPVFDADAAVHHLLAKGGRAVGPVAALFPDALTDGAIDRKILGRLVFGQSDRLQALEAVLHPMVHQDRDRFLARQRRSGKELAILDVPLLLEKDGWKKCDRVMVVTAPAFVQAARVLRRPGMDQARLANIRKAQMPEQTKRRLADFVIHTGLNKGSTLRMALRAVTLTKISVGKARCVKLSWIRKQLV